MKKWITIIIFLIILLIVLGLLTPMLGKSKYDYPYRKKALEMWQKQVLIYETKAGRLPHDLCEVYLFFKDEIDLDNFPIALYQHLAAKDKELLKKNPAYFSEITWYEYVQEGQHWYVKEKHPSGYGSIYSIDERGEIKSEKNG